MSALEQEEGGLAPEVQHGDEVAAFDDGSSGLAEDASTPSQANQVGAVAAAAGSSVRARRLVELQGFDTGGREGPRGEGAQPQALTNTQYVTLRRVGSYRVLVHRGGSTSGLVCVSRRRSG